MGFGDGLILTKELKQLNNWSDALRVVQLMNNNSVNLLMEPLLSDCKNLLKAIPNKWIEHIYREANQCADALARMGLGASTPFVGFMELPPMVESLLAFDKVDMFCNKLINSYSMLIPNFNKKNG